MAPTPTPSANTPDSKFGAEQPPTAALDFEVVLDVELEVVDAVEAAVCEVGEAALTPVMVPVVDAERDARALALELFKAESEAV